MQFVDFLDLFPAQEKRKNRDGDWHLKCPAHDDGQARDKFSLHATRGSDRILAHCFAGCPEERVAAARGLEMRDLFFSSAWPRPDPGTNGQPSPPTRATAPSASPAPRQTESAPASAPREPIATLAGFEARKRIPRAFLEAEGWRDGAQGLTIPYAQRDGALWRVRIRTSLRPGAGFRWDGQKDRGLTPYGRHRLDQIMEKGELWLVEGESDAVTAWIHGLPALGIPGNLAVNTLTAEDLAGIDRLWILLEPGQSGIGFAGGLRERLHALGWQGTAQLVRLPVKDLSDLHVARPEDFGSILSTAQAQAEDLASWEDPKAAPPGDAPDPFLAQFDQPARVTAAAPPDPETKFRTLSWAEMTRDPVPPIAYQWNGWVPRATVALIAGAGESLKSWLALYLAVMIAAGRSALAESSTGEPNLAGGPVLYFTAENSIDEEKRRCSMLKAGLELPDELPITFIAAEGLCLGHDADFAQVVQLVMDRRPVAIVIDSAIAVSGIAQENDNTQVRTFMRARILPLARVHGATVYVIVHSPKPPTQPGARFTDEHVTRGASDWRNAADTVLYLRRDPTLGQQAVVLRHTKSRIGRRHPTIWFELVDVEADRSVRLAYGGTFDESSGQGEAAALAKAVRAIIDVLKATEGGLYLKEIEAQVQATGITKATFRRAASIVRGRAPWPFGPRRGHKRPVVTEDSHGKRKFLTFDPAQTAEFEITDDD